MRAAIAARGMECLTLKYPMCSCASTRLEISRAARVARLWYSTIVGRQWLSVPDDSAIWDMTMVVACTIMKAKNIIGSAIAETTGAFIDSESSVLVNRPSNHSCRSQKSSEVLPKARSAPEI